MDIQIVPYRPEFEPALLELERMSVQGRHLRLEMVRDTFLARSEVFDEFGIFLALGSDDRLLGVAAGAIGKIELNGGLQQVGYTYDVRVAPEHRRKGVAKALGDYLTSIYFASHGVSQFLLTMKAGTKAVVRVTNSVLSSSYSYPFSYLTIPTGMRLGHKPADATEALTFGISLFGQPQDPESILRHPKGDPCLFRTDRLYQIRVRHIASVLNAGMRLLETVRNKAWKLPRRDGTIAFAAAFDFRPGNLDRIDDLLEMAQEAGLPYLVVCCARHDPVYRSLRRLAINALDYCALTNFQIDPESKLILDVRCL